MVAEEDCTVESISPYARQAVEYSFGDCLDRHPKALQKLLTIITGLTEAGPDGAAAFMAGMDPTPQLRRLSDA